MITTILLFCLGLVLVIKGGDWFVDSSVSIAKMFGLPQIFIGATIVSLATTLPELIVSVTAACSGDSIMAVGNGVGSIICNTGLVLSISAIFGNTTINNNDFKTKSMFLVFSIMILYAFGLNQKIERFESLCLVLILIFYFYTNIKMLRSSSNMLSISKKHSNKQNITKITSFFILGIGFIIWGSNLIIVNGTKLALYLNIPTAIISLTLIALGTSLPELVTCITSLVKGNEEIGIGNIIGANILNVLFVIGTSGLITNLDIISQNLLIDLPLTFILTLIMIIPTYFIKKISKVQGFTMLCLYIAYIIYSWIYFI